ncbi:serine/threonine protein kinase [Actinomadura pelletieri DSM 43383]|uniref:Serine/threonine protein kinase n=1 Tax=Actinomadura pelletieri DSM 43383 TaxID=1120940 RepID=A0A495QQ89_9ACTN|nr:serine/threonine-protein kinase [Actinomadura pelletieri]RKS75121.1 serine/threonine protein kinase [Actinomadura pelletieri DSM 43383]
MRGAVTSGDRIGHYSVLQTLGEGGMGVVYLGADPEGRNVAIKVLRPAVAGDATARRRLAREVDSMRRVHSPHVAEILDADVTADQPYIVTQYVPGRTLEEIVEESGPIYGPGLRRLAVGLGTALSAIHGAGIVHRDLKPGNVMLVDGEPIVIDFGIAQAADATRLTATGMVIGTPGYLAPELIEGEDAGPPSDVHAWAGTVAYAATGRPPFGSGTFESIFYKIMQGTPDLDGVPDALLPVLRSAMARHPAERPTAVKLVQLTRRIHLEATITDQTMVDRHYPSSASRSTGSRSAGTAQPIEETAPDHSRNFSMPLPAPHPQDAPPRSSTPGTTALPALPAPGPPPPPPAPAPSPAPAPAQPKDFVGQLPPAAPPPVPPPGPAPYYAPQQYGPPSDQPQDQPRRGALQRRPPEPEGPRGELERADRARADVAARARAERDRRKPYGWYRLISFLVLVALLGFADIAPLFAVGVTIAGVLVLRMGDKAARGMEGRRTRRGPRTGDAVAAAFRTPLHLPGALMATVLWTSLSVLAGLIILGVLIFAASGMTASNAIAYSAMAVIGLLCLAPGSGAPRRQLARIWGAAFPRTGAAAAGALVVGVLAAVLVVLAQERPPDTAPLDGMSRDLEALRADVRDLVSNAPGM